MSRSMIVIRTRYRSNQRIGNKDHALAAYALSKDKNAPIRFSSKKAEERKAARKARLGHPIVKIPSQPLKGGLSIRSPRQLPTIPVQRPPKKLSSKESRLRKLLELDVRPELARKCSGKEATDTLQLLESAARRSVVNKPATKSQTKALIKQGIAADIAIGCSYRDAVLTLLALTKRRCQEPANESQIRRMLQVGIPLDAACGCSFDEADETLRTLEPRSRPETKVGRPDTHGAGFRQIVAMAEQLPVAELDSLVRTLQRTLAHARKGQ